MNNSDHKWIEERLAAGSAPEPPEGLLEKIQEEIPQHLQLVDETPERASEPWRLRLLAASVLIVVLSGTVVYQLLRERPTTFEEQLAEQMERADREALETPSPGAVVEAGPEAATEETVRDSAARLPQIESLAVVDEIGSTSAAKDDERDALPSAVAEQDKARRELEGRLDKKVAAVDVVTEKEESVGARARDSRALKEVGPAEVKGKREGLAQSEAEAPAPMADALWAPRSKEPDARRMSTGNQPGSEELRMRMEQAQAMAYPSTGGTAEPNDAPYGDMFFRPYGTNPFIDTEDDPQSTFGLDVDTGSFTLARSYLDRGHLPPPEAIRVEEFVNYFDYRDPAPRRGEFTLVAEGAPSPFASGPRYQLVRFGIKAREIRAERRQPATLIFVVDTSGSMRRENRLELVKRSLGMLLDQLDRDDRIGLVVYGSRGDVLLEPTANQDAIRRALDRLRPNGSTNAEEGLELAYRLARRYYREGDINRLILCSDGVANVGATGPESILERVRREADDGIELTTVGFGMGNYNDVLMEQLADQGDGSYAYVDSPEEARRIFVEKLTGMLQTIGADAKVQVEFNPETVSRYRLIGYENRDIPDERFRDDTVDAGEIGAGHAVTALYEIKLHKDVSRRQRLATLRLRYRSKATDQIVETSIDFAGKDLSRSWEDSPLSLQLSSLAAEFAEILKGSYWAKDSDLDELYRRLRPVADEMAGEEEVEDLLYLVDRARRLERELPRYIEE